MYETNLAFKQPQIFLNPFGTVPVSACFEVSLHVTLEIREKLSTIDRQALVAAHHTTCAYRSVAHAHCCKFCCVVRGEQSSTRRSVRKEKLQKSYGWKYCNVCSYAPWKKYNETSISTQSDRTAYGCSNNATGSLHRGKAPRNCKNVPMTRAREVTYSCDAFTVHKDITLWLGFNNVE